MNAKVNAPLAVIDLKDTITMGTEVFTQVKLMRKPTLGDMDGLPLGTQPNSSELALLLGRILDISTPTVQNLSLMDLNDVMKEVRPFLPNTPPTGG